MKHISFQDIDYKKFTLLKDGINRRKTGITLLCLNTQRNYDIVHWNARKIQRVLNNDVADFC